LKNERRSAFSGSKKSWSPADPPNYFGVMRNAVLLLALGAVPSLHAQLSITARATLDSLKVVEGAPLKSGESATDVYFRFKGVPSKYYQSLSDHRLTIEFYDALPMRRFEPPVLRPIKSIRLSEEKVEAEKAKGLDSDARDVVRAEVEFDESVSWDYTVTGQAELITLSAVWKKEGKVSLDEGGGRSRWWLYLLGGAVVAGGAALIYVAANQEPDNSSDNLYKK
jgi:hypothetical protein